MACEFIDTHAHLTFPEFDTDRDSVVLRAKDASLRAIITIGAGAGMDANLRAVELAHSYDMVFAAVGVHPHDAQCLADGWFHRLESMLADERVVAVGEIGLDYYRLKDSPEIQQERFRELLLLAHRVSKPVIIHDREAHEDVWKIIEEVGVPPRGGVFHCFSGDKAFAERVIQAGFHISITGIVTFKNAKTLHEVVAATPLERMLLETDCPYLAPEPYRGKRNEPAFVTEVAKRVAQIKGLSVEDVSRVTTLTAARLFNLPGSELLPRIAYRIRNSLYLNITNRCNLACRFCPKFTDFEVKGYFLKLPHEPSVDEIFQEIGLSEKYDEVVFCGYGEPTLRLEVLKTIAAQMKDSGVKHVRLNTDGLASLVYGRNILPELATIVDAVSVSLNASDATTYAKNCPSKFGESAYLAVCAFIAEAKKYIPDVVASVVAIPGLDLEDCRKRAEELGVSLRIREYMNVG